MARAEGEFPVVTDQASPAELCGALNLEGLIRTILEVLTRAVAGLVLIRARDAWHDSNHDPTVADSICDRVIHNAHRVALKGPSRRKEKTEKN